MPVDPRSRRPERLPGALGPPHPRPHSPRACSVRPWELPAESQTAPAPSPPNASKVGGSAGARGRARCPPVALWRPCSLHRPCPTPRASLLRRPHGWEQRRGCHPSPLPEARSEAGWPEAWWWGLLPSRQTCSRCARHTHGPSAVSRLSERGCVSTGLLAHTLAVTHKALVS